MSAKEITALVEAVASTPGWSAEADGSKWKITPPTGPLIFHPKRSLGHGLDNFRSTLRRAGWVDPAGKTQATSTRSERQIIAREPHAPGIERVLWDDETEEYACINSGCVQLRFEDTETAQQHRDGAHPTTNPEDTPMALPAPPTPEARAARVNGTSPARPRSAMTADDAITMLTSAAAHLQRVVDWLGDQTSGAERIADLERQLREERALRTADTERIQQMQQAARLLMGGTP